MKKLFLSTVLSLFFMVCYGRYSMEYTGKRTQLFHNGRAVDFEQCAVEQMQRYPESEILDLVKLAYQAAWGPAHGIGDRERAWKYFSREFAEAKADETLPLFEVISPDYCRFNLGAWKAAGLPEQWLFNMFCASAETLPDSQLIFDNYICQLRKLLADRKEELDNFMKRYQGGAVIIRHTIAGNTILLTGWSIYGLSRHCQYCERQQKCRKKKFRSLLLTAGLLPEKLPLPVNLL
jgi:hypothetical protein